MPNTKPTVEERHADLRRTLDMARQSADDLMTEPDKAFYASSLSFWAGHVTSDSVALVAAAMVEDKEKEQVHA